MKKIIYFIVLLLTVGLYSCNTAEKKEQKCDGIIRTEIPQRPSGQEDLVGFRCAPMETVRVAFIGLGMRGPGAVERFTHIPGVEITALCDLYPERVEKTQEILVKANRPKAAAYSGEEGWKELCQREDIL